MNSVLSAFLLTFAGLFPIVNPIEAAPFFLGLTAGMSSAERTMLARKAAINGFALLLGSMVLGPWLLEFFGIELPVMRIAGGLVNGLAGIPLLALAPFMAVWFGIGDGSKVALAFAVAVFPIMSDITSGLARGKSHATEASPNATRCVLATLRRALVLAVAAVLIGEMVAATHGLGYLMMTSVATFDTATLAAVTLVAALPCAFVVSLIRWIEETFA